jgi:epoxyqueuosine reductase
MNKTSLSQFIKSESSKRGFSNCGIAKARKLEEHEPRLTNWLKEGKHGRMQYMENNFDKRLDPRLLVDSAKSVISLMMNYYSEKENNYTSPLKVSKYAWSIDYHVVIKNKLYDLINSVSEKVGNFNFRIFVDSAPVLDRAWAVEAGIGWIGKNSMLISRKNGSFYFLAEIICDLDLEYDQPFGGSYCGDCTRCIDSCPTGAITKDKDIDSNKCISYLTIELKDDIESAFSGHYQDWIFGCDICQDVCPWNKFSIKNSIPEFKPIGNWQEWSVADWNQMDKPLFKEMFGKSALTRAGLVKIKNNINFVTISK